MYIKKKKTLERFYLFSFTGKETVSRVKKQCHNIFYTNFLQDSNPSGYEFYADMVSIFTEIFAHAWYHWHHGVSNFSKVF